MMAISAAMNDRALALLCRTIEQSDPRIGPDAVWLSDEEEVYEHLREIGAMSLSHELASNVACRHCGIESYRPEINVESHDPESPYRGYCAACRGWVELRSEQARLWCAHPVKLARWLASALHLTQKYMVEPVVDGVLWRLGELEHRRKRRTLYFGRRLAEFPDTVRQALEQLSAPGAEVILTASDTAALRTSVLAACTLVPLRAVVHLKKAGFVVENLTPYLGGTTHLDEDEPSVSRETSLRRMHAAKVALINGVPVNLPPQVYEFLSILWYADGDDVHKSRIAAAMNLAPDFRKADIFKRHAHVFDTFIGMDGKGRYWLKPEFLPLPEDER